MSITKDLRGLVPALVDTYLEGPVDPVRIPRRDASGRLLIGGLSANELADRFGTPLHAIDEDRLRENARGFRDAFTRVWPATEVYYSYKTNSVGAVIETLHEEGFGAEIVSPYEGWLAEKLGVPGKRVVVNGPGKVDSFIERVVRQGVRLYNIDSFSEIHRVARVASAAGVTVPVGIRLRPPVGWSGQFGFDDDHVLEAVRQIASYPSLELTGLHAHVGTNIRESESHRRLVRFLALQAERILAAHGIAISLLDIGGGYGVNGVRPVGALDILRLWFSEGARVPRRMRTVPLSETAGEIAKELEQVFQRSRLPKPTLLLEPGRAVTSESHTLLVRVLDIKQRSSGHTYVITDAGAMGYCMSLRWEWHELIHAGRNDAERKEYDVVGPLCTPSDALGRSIRLPPVQPGDVLALRDTGAYFPGLESNFAFPRSALAMAASGNARLVRRRETFEDMSARDDLVQGAADVRNDNMQRAPMPYA
jgi:diaminopimelate decarboxylase